ncbi:MAG: hypothetical protein HYS65_10390 [Betaproteobacteria bacterium]|nr:hypothetical protein [Betaproteobacteria bacterium]
MSATFPENYRDLFQKKAFGAFTTLMPDGGPQTTPVWTRKYLGQDQYPFRQPGEQRVLYKISIEKAHAMG